MAQTSSVISQNKNNGSFSRESQLQRAAYISLLHYVSRMRSCTRSYYPARSGSSKSAVAPDETLSAHTVHCSGINPASNDAIQCAPIHSASSGCACDYALARSQPASTPLKYCSGVEFPTVVNFPRLFGADHGRHHAHNFRLSSIIPSRLLASCRHLTSNSPRRRRRPPLPPPPPARR